MYVLKDGLCVVRIQAGQYGRSAVKKMVDKNKKLEQVFPSVVYCLSKDRPMIVSYAHIAVKYIEAGIRPAKRHCLFRVSDSENKRTD